jgi:hypothetical protein
MVTFKYDNPRQFVEDLKNNPKILTELTMDVIRNKSEDKSKIILAQVHFDSGEILDINFNLTKENIVLTLEKNLLIYEEIEEYETCSEIVSLIDKFKN